MSVPKFYSQDEMRRRRDVFTRVWRLEDIGRPAFQVWRSGVAYSTRECLRDTGKLLESELSGLEARARYDCDGPPFLFPYVGVGPIPSAFGCRVAVGEDHEPVVLPLIEKPEDVYKLGKPSTETGMSGDVLDQLRFLDEANRGYYDIRMHDLQGPFSAAGQIWGYEDFLSAVLNHPTEAHHLLRLVTDYIIDFVEAQRRIVPGLILCHCCPDWIPPGYGISVSDDIAAVVSPRVYEEFAVPYNNVLSDRFGGIFVHSCGNSSRNFETVLKHRNFRGLNFEAADNPYPEAVRKLGRGSLIAPHPGLQFKNKFGSAAGYVKYMLANTPPGVPYIISLWCDIFDPSTGMSEDDASMDEAVEMLSVRTQDVR